jgi:hypothetical protein
VKGRSALKATGNEKDKNSKTESEKNSQLLTEVNRYVESCGVTVVTPVSLLSLPRVLSSSVQHRFDRLLTGIKLSEQGYVLRQLTSTPLMLR